MEPVLFLSVLKIMMELEKILLSLTIATSMVSDILSGLSKVLDNFLL